MSLGPTAGRAGGSRSLMLGTLTAAWATILPAGAALAACLDGAEVARLVTMIGEVRVNGRPPQGNLPDIILCTGDEIALGTAARATIYLLAADTPLRFDQETTARLYAPPDPESGLIEVARGAVYFLSEVRRTLTIRTPYANAGVEGTEVYLRVADGGTEMIVLEGRVGLQVPQGGPAGSPDLPPVTTGERIVVDAAGTTTRAALPGDGPFGALRRVAVGQLSWALYYPDILPGVEAAADPRLAEAARLLAAGQDVAARALLDTISGTGAISGLRDVLLASIAFGRGDRALLDRLASNAIAAAPDMAAPRLAQSYARQLALDLDGASAAAEQATTLAPRSPLPWARAAELHLMRGEVRAARAAARRSVELGGGALAEVAQGFAELAAFRGAAAESAFRRALAVESQNPTALLGLGLALIKQGDLAEGSRQIQTSVLHDPSSGLLRAYLGKALLQAGDDRRATKQLEIARELAPEDPTAWYYTALLKQLNNRPVEALRDVDRAIALNVNRSPFRSGILLDQDRAAGLARLGWIYDELGFRGAAIPQAAEGLARDAGSAAARRLLADTYAGLPRYEVARVSNTLQATLLAPVGTVPIRPSEAFTDLSMPVGFFGERVGFNEYGALFNEDGLSGSVSGLVGNHQTFSNEAVATFLRNGTALSAGQFHYQTNGFRENFNSRQDVLQFRLQQALGSDGMVLLEHRQRSGHEGDLALVGDMENFSGENHLDVNDRLSRLGFFWRFGPAASFMTTADLGKRTDEPHSEDPDFFPQDTRADDTGHVIQAQFLGRRGPFELVAGTAVGRIDSYNRDTLTIDGQDVELNSIHDDQDQFAAYGYLNVNPLPALTLTLGLGYESIEGGVKDRSQLEPKLGAMLRFAPGWVLRAGYMETVKRRLVVDETLEPTAIVGFNQFFDDANSTQSKRRGIAVDGRIGENLFVGLSATRRDLQEPGLVFSQSSQQTSVVDNQADEYGIDAYAYRMLGNRVAVGAEFHYNHFEDNNDSGLAASNAPSELKSWYVPLNIRYFDPSGLFAGMSATPLRQDVRIFVTDAQGIEQSDEMTVLVDAQVGFRFRDGRGRIGLEVWNVLDHKFDFTDDNFRTNRTQVFHYLPDRTILLRGIFNF
jgi:tetratricopeptide (TPR) repeat protein